MKITKAQLSQIIREELTQVIKEQSDLFGDLLEFAIPVDVLTTPTSTPPAAPTPEPEAEPIPQPAATSPRVQATQIRQTNKTERAKVRQTNKTERAKARLAARTARAPTEQTVGINVPKGVPGIGGAGVTMTTKRNTTN